MKGAKSRGERQVNHYCELRPESELAKIKAGFRSEMYIARFRTWTALLRCRWH